MASILTFPNAPASPSDEESAVNRPRPRPHLVNRVINPDTRPNDGKAFRESSEFIESNESIETAGRLDLELGRRSNRNRLRRIFNASSRPDPTPHDAA